MGSTVELTLQIVATVLAHGLSWLAVCHALLSKRDPRSALGWTVTALFLPLLGPLLYLLFGISRAESRAEKIMHEIASHEANYPQIPPPVPLASIPENTLRMARMGQQLTGSPLCGGNRLRILHNGDEAYPAMLEAIANAHRHVWLLTYIFNAGQVASEFCAALRAAHERGVDVRVLVDGVGALYSWRKPWRELASEGISVGVFREPRLFPPNWGINLRNHRKLLVCDGLAFTGGMNIADDNVQSGASHCVQDVHFACSGPIVGQLRRAFLINWGFATGTYPPLPAADDRPAGNSYCRIVMDGPGTDADVLHDLYCGAINSALHHVRIMTPYFLPTHDLTAALRSAAQRGVDVRIVLPGKNNLAPVHWASLRLLPALLQAGVRVWLQPPPFAHTKLLAVDGYYCQFGSANLDARSLRLNFELNTEVFDTALHDALAAHMDDAATRGEEITLSRLAAQSLPARLRNAACWLFSPYL